MKKKMIGIIAIVILNLIMAVPVLAKSEMSAKLVSNRLELKANETVEITFSFDQLKEINKGINSYKGTLEYDKAIFEEIEQSDFVCQNNWESLKFNRKTGEFVAIRKVGTKISENVVKIKLKVKNGVSPTKTSIKLSNITTS